jgi:cytochrome c oxidase subunit 1
MHFLGLAGMPRRIPEYSIAFTQWNVLSTYGSYISNLAIIIFIFGLVISLSSKNIKANFNTIANT